MDTEATVLDIEKNLDIIVFDINVNIDFGGWQGSRCQTEAAPLSDAQSLTWKAAGPGRAGSDVSTIAIAPPQWQTGIAKSPVLMDLQSEALQSQVLPVSRCLAEGPPSERWRLVQSTPSH